MRDPYALTGLQVLVTGGGQGIGRAVALACAARGARVIVSDRELDPATAVAGEVRAAGGTATAAALDVGDPAAAAALVAGLEGRGERLDVLVNNAGVSSPPVPSAELRPEEWDRIHAVNVRGLFFAAQAAGRHMVAHGGGSIVNIASQLGIVGSSRRAAYTASKAAVVNLTRSLAIEWAPHGVRVNAVGPGPVVTPMTALARSTPELYRDFVSRIPLGRYGEPEEIAACVVFLASPAASFVTGHTLIADGGFTAH